MLHILCLLYLTGWCSGTVVCPDGESECQDGETCCELSGGGYGCCPMPKATCCKDKVHCCPHGYFCDVATATCFHSSNDGGADNHIVMLLKKPAKKIQRTAHQISVISKLHTSHPVSNIMCPDRYSFCPSGTTCCLLLNGRYGCCQYCNAVCCNDHIHCCPHNYVCNIPYCSPRQEYKEEAMVELTKQDVKGSYLVHLYASCPDGKGSCDNGKKCCHSKSGSYSCCAYESGVCCSDGLHCCPERFTCNLVIKKCTRKLEKIAMGVKLKAKTLVTIPYIKAIPHVNKQLIKTKVITCPGGKYFCLHGETCCKVEKGVYGCCPQPRAICCKDHTHCCPQHSACDVQASKCIGPDGRTTTILYKHPAEFRPDDEIIPALIQCPIPDETHYCPDTSTCCSDLSGTYSCCPIKNAICCASKIFCCPQGSCCGTHGCGTCDKDNAVIKVTIPGVKKISMKKYETCPDKKHACPLDTRCCLSNSGLYKCCPFKNAVCCKGKDYCCPLGTKCMGALCVRGHYRFQATKHIDPFPIKKTHKQQSSSSEHQVLLITCGDNKTTCDDNNTCCLYAGGHYACCSLPHAVCCKDTSHCCPKGFVCGGQGICNKPAKPAITSDTTCPDGVSQCPDNNTCCKLPSGVYGCCPLVKAVCCADHKHCCPAGYTCSAGYCTKGNEKLPVANYALGSVKSVASVTCADKTECPDGSTCCLVDGGAYACCPLPNAVCCSDHQHCCPHGYKCSEGFCIKGGVKILASQHIKGIAKLREQIVCDDNKSRCDYGSTCCQRVGGDYGCCPLLKAVCCADKEHCCPNGFQCKSGGYCARESDWIPAYVHSGVRSVNIMCPDRESWCYAGNTCCKLRGGHYGCCPLPNAVCCADHEHCCPHGYICSEGFCIRGADRMVASTHTNVARKVNRPVICPDKVSECADGQTCCKLATGAYGCCPLRNAVCCADHKHCCPHGYQCTSQGYCTNRVGIIPAKSVNAIRKNPSTVYMKDLSLKKAADLICPDGQTVCDQGTCCECGGGNYNCCPLTDAVCCLDHEHCCPTDTICVPGGRCAKGNELTMATRRQVSILPANIICPDGVSECSDGSTCCMLVNGSYGCCPLPKAVCCNDHEHCCPNGFNCTAGGYCSSKDGKTIPASKHKNAFRRHQGDYHRCPDKKSYCPNDSTCCQRIGTGYGCCPVVDAVCCADDKYCCRQGFTCIHDGRCKKGNEVIAALQKFQPVRFPVIERKHRRLGDRFSKPHTSEVLRMSLQQMESLSPRDKFLLKILNHRLQTCADGIRKCKQYETCCSTNDGYICCPIFNAVCCKDMCCPTGSACSKKDVCERFPVPNEHIKFNPSSESYLVEDGDVAP